MYIAQVLICAIMLFGGSIFSQESKIKSGVNIQASYYNEGRVNIGWDLMQEYPEIEAVRIEIEPYREHEAIRWIREAHENGYQVIATYHKSAVLGSDQKEELLLAAEWWIDNYDIYASTGPVLINVMNEWGSHNISPEEYAEAYNESIELIRTVYDGSLIVDVPGWGQATKIAADAFHLFEDQDVIFSLHIYTSAFNIEAKRWLTIDDLTYLDATGADCIVGEFCDTPTGGADWCSIIDHCYENGWPLFGWAWNGDGRAMNMVEPSWRDDPAAETYRPTAFLKKIMDKLRGIRCFTQADEDCTGNLIGEKCDDDNGYTVNDRYNEYCNCVGNFTNILQSNTSDEDLIIYPNPVSNKQELSIDLFKINTTGHLDVFNSLGQTLLSESISFNQNRVPIDTYQFTSGVYWASFRTEGKVVVSRAFVVQ